MNNYPRLFAGSRAKNQHFKLLSSENFIIALLDIYTDDAHLRQRICVLSNYHYYRASTINNCIDLIVQDEAKNAVIILLISNRFLDAVRQNLLPIVPQVTHIYLFDSMLYKLRLPNDQRFRGTYDDAHSLLTKINEDIKQIRELPPVAQGIQFIFEDDVQFFWYRFFFNVLDRLQCIPIAKEELVSEVREYYGKNCHQLVLIDDFERTYESKVAIYWYSKESFFYHSLNKALDQNDINKIFLWRSYIQDLQKALRQLRFEQEHFTPRFLYRGTLLAIDQINKLRRNVGKLITMTSFICTSLNKEVAMMYAGFGCSVTDSTYSLVFITIKIDANDTKAVFANIQPFSAIMDEEVVLFSLRSLYRIDGIMDIDNICHIDVTVVDENDQEFCEAINPWKTRISEQSFLAGRHQQLFTRYLTVENSSFLAFQLLIDLMLRLNQTSYARKEMIQMCQLKYSDSLPDRIKINEFELTYRHKDAARWYTTDSFLYRLINTSLRLEDIDTLFKLRYYIYDLHNQLDDLQPSYIKSLPPNKSILTLYRGERMTIDELNKHRENIGQLISKNSFLSTTSDITAAVFFSGDGSLDNPDRQVSVVYQITVDIKILHITPFARIDYLNNIEQYGALWIVDLTLVNKEDEEWNKVAAHLNK